MNNLEIAEDQWQRCSDVKGKYDLINLANAYIKELKKQNKELNKILNTPVLESEWQELKNQNEYLKYKNEELQSRINEMNKAYEGYDF